MDDFDKEWPIARMLLAIGLVAIALTVGMTRKVKSHEGHLPHEKFYKTWMKPDAPTQSCCSDIDCYPTQARQIKGVWHFQRREDGKWIRIPPEKVEINRDNPDGRNHVCASKPTDFNPDGTVYCFIPGGGT